MKKMLLGAAAATLLMTGCTDNELLDGGISTPNDGKIYFSATSGVPTNTKAAPGNPINSTNDLQKIGVFHVLGYVDGAGAAYVNANPRFNGVSWEYDNEPYWPNATMDFYAYANWATAPTIHPTDGITAAGVAIADDVLGEAGHKDLLVAITPGATKEVRTLLTFKHALTQIVFKAGNINPSKITADITGVEIVNVAKSGDMVFKKGEKIKWAAPTVGAADLATKPKYTVQGIGNTVATGFNVPDLSVTPNDYSKFPRIQTVPETDNNALMLVPQSFPAWDTNSGTAATANAQTGAYIKLTALVKSKDHVFGADDTENNKYIYAGKSTGNGTVFEAGAVYIPVESLWDNATDQNPQNAGAWVPGKRINYIITFGDSNSGSGGGGYDENGNPILVPIRFRAVVEDWVETDVPLLTATFEASSSAITHKFIDGYTNQLLNDIKAAPAPKVYNAEIKLKGTNSANIGAAGDYATTNILTPANVTFQDILAGGAGNTFQNAKFLPGSTLKYDMADVSNLNTYNAKIVVPTGWQGQRTLNGTVIDAAPLADGYVFTLNGTDANGVLLTKVATLGYNYISQASYIESNLAAVELNENYATGAGRFTNTITVYDPMPSSPTAYFFSSDMLAKFENAAFDASTLTIDLTAVTIDATRSIQTVVPKGWIITKTEGAAPVTTYYPNDLVSFGSAATGVTKTLKYTKQLGNPNVAGNWKNEQELEYWLTQTKTISNNVFYYDNTDGLTTVDLNAANLYLGSTKKWSDMTGNGTIYFRNSVGVVKIAENAGATGTWDWDNVERKLIYNSTATGQAALNYTYLTKAVALAKDAGSHYIVGSAPAAWNETWIPAGPITLIFSEKAVSPSADRFGWAYTVGTQSAAYTAPTAVTDVAAVGTALSAANAWVVTDVVDLSSVDVTGVTLAQGAKLYIMVTGTGAIIKPTVGAANWTVSGRVLTYTEPASAP